MDDKPMMEDMVNEIARRVAKRLKGLKKSPSKKSIVNI